MVRGERRGRWNDILLGIKILAVREEVRGVGRHLAPQLKQKSNVLIEVNDFFLSLILILSLLIFGRINIQYNQIDFKFGLD